MSPNYEGAGDKSPTLRRAGRLRPSAPQSAAQPKATRSGAVGTTLRDGLLAACRPLAGDLARRRRAFLAEPDAANVHALRGAARRLRAAIWLFEDALSPLDTTWARRELKWLTRQLGVLRDLDVLLGRLAEGRREHYHRDTQPEDLLLGLATLARRARLASAVEALRSARATVLVEGFEAWLFEAAAALTAGVAAPDAVRPALARLDARVRAAGLGVIRFGRRRRHALRGEVKTLRYGTETFAVVVGDEVAARYHACLIDLGRVLGDLNDDAVGMRLSRRLAPACAARPYDRTAQLRAAWTAFKESTPAWPGGKEPPSSPAH